MYAPVKKAGIRIGTYRVTLSGWFAGSINGGTARIGTDNLHSEPPLSGGIESDIHNPIHSGLGHSEFQTAGIVAEVITRFPEQTAGLYRKTADLAILGMNGPVYFCIACLNTTILQNFKIIVSRNKPLKGNVVAFDFYTVTADTNKGF